MQTGKQIENGVLLQGQAQLGGILVVNLLLLLLRHVTPNLAQLHRHLGDLHGRILGLDLTSLLVRKEEEGRHGTFGCTLFHEQTQMLIRGLCFDGRAFGRPGRAEDHRTWSSRDCTGFYLLRLV